MSARDVIRATILGCGSSGGVPRLGGDWGACDPDEPRNHRLRCSLLVERGPPGAAQEERTIVLIDTAPDLRAQLLTAGIGRLDAVLYTHDHADQAHGIDDLRPIVLRRGKSLPVHMDAATAATLTKRFSYCFQGAGRGLYPPILEARVDLEPGRALTIEGPGGPISFTPLDQEHGPTRSLGFRFGAMAYSNDVNAMPEASFDALSGLEVWIVDTLRYRPHVSHANLETALAWIERVQPKRAILTNLHVDLDYRRLAAETPDHVEPAYDGMSMTLEIDALTNAQVS